MPLWKNIRRLSFSGPVQGVVNPGPADVILPMQAVQVLDDASHAVQPATVPRGFVSPTSAPAALEHSGIEFAAAAGGLWVERWWGTGFADNIDLWRDDNQVVAVRTPVVLMQVGGVPNLARFAAGINSVQIAAAQLPASRIPVVTGTTSLHETWYQFMRPGEKWYFVDNVVNSSIVQTFQVREVPTTERNA